VWFLVLTVYLGGSVASNQYGPFPTDDACWEAASKPVLSMSAAGVQVKAYCEMRL
jgi:hypothetical protein